MRPQMTPVGGKICRGGSYCRLWEAARDEGKPRFIGFFGATCPCMALAEEPA